MDNDKYFEMLSDEFEKAYAVASKAREKGYDPQPYVEIKPAPDLAARVEGIMGINGLAETIRKNSDGKSRQELAFAMTALVCSSADFPADPAKRMTAAVRIGLCILTEGILVAPTEGFQGVEIHRNPDGSDYASAVYAGPIRGAGGTSAALSVALADHGRRLLGISAYKAQQAEIERYLEEIMLYDSRIARLQYAPSEADLRCILQNCPVCIDGVPTEQMEVAIHRNVKRLDSAGRQQLITNKIRGGIPLVLCEGIAQKAKSVLKHTRTAGLDWSWLDGIIRVDKPTGGDAKANGEAVFLQELVAGRPVLSYPEHAGSFRLRYGRSRLTGIAAKGLNPATMILLDSFIATGTQLKVEKPGKGCIAMPVDSIEGPFVKLASGEALRVNTADKANEVRDKVAKILAVGDILITFGDFKKTNTPLLPSSYVEEYWCAELAEAGYTGGTDVGSFDEAMALSVRYGVPMHPRYTYEYQDATVGELASVAGAAIRSLGSCKHLREIESIELAGPDMETIRSGIERLCVPHMDNGNSITISGDEARSLVAALGLADASGAVSQNAKLLEQAKRLTDPLELVRSVAPFRVERRSTRIGGRMGRPEKARERLMKPAPHVLFPIGERGGKERNIHKAYIDDRRRFGSPNIEVEMPRYFCAKGGEATTTPYCREHGSRSVVRRQCRNCGTETMDDVCPRCGGKTSGAAARTIDLAGMMVAALENIGIHEVPKTFKGVKGLMSLDKVTEPLEKGLLRSMHSVFIFKDGTSRFDATDAPMTHFYPVEVGTSVERLRQLGYTTDASGAPLERADQLVELRHQDVVLNTRCADYMLGIAKFIDDLLVRFYKMEPFYRVSSPQELVGHLVITLSPHTSAGVLGRIIGFTKANVGFAHPYTISARRRNCDGDEDTTMLLLDTLINFSRSYLPVTVGGTMDAPLILTVHVMPEEVDDEVHSMEVVESYGLGFYRKSMEYASPGSVKVELVADRLGGEGAYQGIRFTHQSGPSAVTDAPVKSVYTTLKSMNEKVERQFALMDKLYCIDRTDTARRLILSHFIPDLMGNLHSFSKQQFRCVSCNAKYRRVPLRGKCTRCGGRLLLTISRGGIEKYMTMATTLADRYGVEPYIKQRLALLKSEIEELFGGLTDVTERGTKQFNLSKFM